MTARQRTALVLLAALAAFAALCATARADMPSPAELDVMRSVARAEFPGACGPVDWRESWETVLDPSGYPWAASATVFTGQWPGEECRLTVYPAQFAAGTRRAQCSVVVHEFGHLAGLGHSPDPASVMHAPVTMIPEGCRLAFPLGPPFDDGRSQWPSRGSVCVNLRPRRKPNACGAWHVAGQGRGGHRAALQGLRAR